MFPPSRRIANRIIPCRLHVPATPLCVGVITRTGPPVISTRATWTRCAKKAIDWLSGDQNGAEALSVPSISLVLPESRALSHSIGLPFEDAVNATHLPSGEIADDSTVALSGGRMESCTSPAGAVPRRSSPASRRVIAAPNTAPAANIVTGFLEWGTAGPRDLKSGT